MSIDRIWAICAALPECAVDGEQQLLDGYRLAAPKTLVQQLDRPGDRS